MSKESKQQNKISRELYVIGRQDNNVVVATRGLLWRTLITACVSSGSDHVSRAHKQHVISQRNYRAKP